MHRGVRYIRLYYRCYSWMSVLKLYVHDQDVPQRSYPEHSSNKKLLTAENTDCKVHIWMLNRLNEPWCPRAVTSRQMTFRRWMVADWLSFCSIEQLSLRMTQAAVDMKWFYWFNYADKTGYTCFPAEYSEWCEVNSWHYPPSIYTT